MAKTKNVTTSFENPIWVAGQVDMVNFFMGFTKRYSELMSQTKVGDTITVFINSQGGDSQTGLALFDLLSNSDRNVIGVVIGTAQSAASLILQGCRKRLMTENSILMLHKSTVTAGGSVDNAQAALNIFRSVDHKYYEIYATRSGEKVARISEMAHKDKYFSSKEALEAGLIDKII